MSISRSQDDVSLDLGICNLSDNVLVGEADDEAVLGRVVLVLGLCDETLSCVEVGLSLSGLSMELIEGCNVSRLNLAILCQGEA